MILVLALLLLCRRFWLPQWCFLCHAALTGGLCLTQLTLAQGLWPCSAFGGINGTCFPSNPCVWWHSHSAGCSAGQEERMLCSPSSSAGQVFGRSFWVSRWLLFPLEGAGKGAWHVCLCNRSRWARYTMSAVISIDLFAFHCEAFHVATWKMIFLKVWCSTELVLTSKNQGKMSRGESRDIKMINCCISIQAQSVFCFTDCLFLRIWLWLLGCIKRCVS